MTVGFKNLIGVTSLVVFASAALLFGRGAGADEVAQKAHEHGVGNLNVAVQGKEVEMELTAPGADIVGFEHKPSTTDQKKAVRDAVAVLKDGEKLFSFPAAAGCRMEEAEVASALIADEEHDHKDDHKDEHKHGHDDDHAKEGAGESHAEFRVHYHFECERPDRLTHIDVRFFEQFPNARELESQVIGAKGQTAAELTPTAARLKF